jgi:hypothetical protein
MKNIFKVMIKSKNAKFELEKKKPWMSEKHKVKYGKIGR